MIGVRLKLLNMKQKFPDDGSIGIVHITAFCKEWSNIQVYANNTQGEWNHGLGLYELRHVYAYMHAYTASSVVLFWTT